MEIRTTIAASTATVSPTATATMYTQPKRNRKSNMGCAIVSFLVKESGAQSGAKFVLVYVSHTYHSPWIAWWGKQCGKQWLPLMPLQMTLVGPAAVTTDNIWLTPVPPWRCLVHNHPFGLTPPAALSCVCAHRRTGKEMADSGPSPPGYIFWL